MIYTAKRLNSPERIAEGIYKGFHYYVLNLGTHPCAYIDVTDTNLNGIHYSNIDIECHGGLTYSDDNLATVNKIGWFIGWDYAHYYDFAGYYLEHNNYIFDECKKWTTEEIVHECKEVIDQLAKIRLDEAIAEIKRWQKAEIGEIE